jgi:hypothetical protein
MFVFFLKKMDSAGKPALFEKTPPQSFPIPGFEGAGRRALGESLERDWSARFHGAERLGKEKNLLFRMFVEMAEKSFHKIWKSPFPALNLQKSEGKATNCNEKQTKPDGG